MAPKKKKIPKPAPKPKDTSKKKKKNIPDGFAIKSKPKKTKIKIVKAVNILIKMKISEPMFVNVNSLNKSLTKRGLKKTGKNVIVKPQQILGIKLPTHIKLKSDNPKCIHDKIKSKANPNTGEFSQKIPPKITKSV